MEERFLQQGKAIHGNPGGYGCRRKVGPEGIWKFGGRGDTFNAQERAVLERQADGTCFGGVEEGQVQQGKLGRGCFGVPRHVQTIIQDFP